MLTEKRQEEIVRLVQERESITVAELKDILQTSESTIRHTANGGFRSLQNVF